MSDEDTKAAGEADAKAMDQERVRSGTKTAKPDEPPPLPEEKTVEQDPSEQPS